MSSFQKELISCHTISLKYMQEYHVDGNNLIEE